MASISLVIDKSSFQSLNDKELILLHRYFIHNATPILVMEVLGDLKKDESHESKVKVQGLANKMLPTNSVMNDNYLDLITGELLGNYIRMDYRPLLGNAKLLEDGKGILGMKIEESENEKTVTRWKNGEFTDIDELLSQIWRETTTDKDILENLKRKIQIPDDRIKEIKSIAHAKEYVQELTSNIENQTDLLKVMISEFSVSTADASRIFLRWEQTDRKILAEFAPYAVFCIQIILTFHVALKKGLVGTRPTNKLDLEYLFYLPFCRLFVTDDKFQKMLAPAFLSDEQMFVTGQEIKADLQQIDSYLSTVSEKKDVERLKKEPPQIPDFLIYKIWANFLEWPVKRMPPSTDAERERALERFKEILKAQEKSDLSGYQPREEMDFIIKERVLRDTDPCPCGSGRSLRDCMSTHSQL